MLERVWKREGNAHWYNHYGKQCGGFSKKLKIELPCDSAIRPLGIYNLIIYLLLAVLGLHCYVGLSLVVTIRLLSSCTGFS